MFRLELNSMRPDVLEELAGNMDKAIDGSKKILISPIYRINPDSDLVNAVNLTIGEHNEHDMFIGIDADFDAVINDGIGTENDPEEE